MTALEDLEERQLELVCTAPLNAEADTERHPHGGMVACTRAGVKDGSSRDGGTIPPQRSKVGRIDLGGERV